MHWGPRLIVTSALLPVVALGCGRIGYEDVLQNSVPSGDGALSRGSGGADAGTDAEARNTETGGATPGTARDASATDGSGVEDAADAEPRVAITVTPTAAAALTSGSLRFVAEVTGTADVSATWSVVEGAAGGTIDAAGLYTAPATPGTYHVVAQSHADAAEEATASIVVSLPAATGIGTWVNVTPAGISLDSALGSGGNYGVQDIVVDPARPSDLYAFVCYQGVWRSTDYGQTWAKISTGQNGSVLDTGRPWTAAIDPDPNRDPSTAPTLYTANGYGVQGIFKSTDGGVNWTRYTFPARTGQDVFTIDVDPHDVRHLIAGFHQSSGFAESTDGAVTWTVITTLPTVPDSSIASYFPAFVDTGRASTTRATWLAIAQGDGAVGGPGIYRTTDRGATWTQTLAVAVGGATPQIFQADGVLYAALLYGIGGQPGGIYKSSDSGVSWPLKASVAATIGITGTPSYLYHWFSWATFSGVAPSMARAPRAADGTWTSMPTPPGMTNGPKRVAVTYDGTHYVLVGGNWNAGIWRYVEL